MRAHITLPLWLLIASCRVAPPAPPTGGLELEPSEFFDGNLEVDGAVYGPLGRRFERYSITLDAEPAPDGVWVRESARIHGGGTSRSVYLIRQHGEDDFEVCSDDFPLPGVGERYGNGILWRYQMRRKEGAGAGILFSARDYMIPRGSNTLYNFVEIRKLGLRFGHIEQVIRRR